MKRYIRSSLNPDELDVPESAKHGNCFEVALHTFMEDPQNYILVHGVVSGQGPLDGIKYCHAWVLDGDTVIDNTQKKLNRLPKVVYYSLGDISITREYDSKDVYNMMEKYGTYGPWDFIFDNYY